MSGTALRVIKPGLLTTVQDIGRSGWQASGVPVAGPMDAFSHRLANALVGNAPEAAVLEMTLIGPEIEAETDVTIAVTGAEFEMWCDGRLVSMGASSIIPAGHRLRFGKRLQGARAYLAVAGGIDTPPVLGSRATHLVSRMGGLEGRALVAGDRLPVAPPGPPAPPRKAVGLTLPSAGRARVRVMPGPQADWFSADALKALTSVSFQVSPRSNRMGFRLLGPPLSRVHAGELVSEPMGMGAIQVPAAGDPILLMADRQTAGGYPQIAYVISADLPVAGQLAPGDFVEFVLCSRQEAVAALIARERQLLRFVDLRGDRGL